MRNVKLALRTLLRTPFVTIVAALSLALGIGSNTAIYSIFDMMLRRPLPVSHPEQLVNLGAPGPKPGSTSCSTAGGCELVFSYPMMRDLQKAERSPFSGLAGHRGTGANISIADLSLNVQGLMVTGNYFPTLGLVPAMGRLIGPSDDETIGGHYVAVLTYSFWDAKLGRDPNVVGKTMTANGKQLNIIGVAPKDFEGTVLGERPVFFAPMTMRTELGAGSAAGLLNRQNYWVYVFGRLKPGVAFDEAKVAINAAYTPVLNEIEAPLQQGMSDQTMKQFRARQVSLEDGRRGQSDVFREAKTPLILLLSITGIVLLIACANIANLLLAQAANRQMEMAVRLSIGATRGKLLAQLLTESVVLALFGGVMSLMFAHWTLKGITALLPGEITQTMTFDMSWAAVLFAMAMSVVTGILFGLFPALNSTRPDLVSALRNNSGKLSGGRAAARFRTTLATAQVALSMALLMCAGLFVKSLWKVSRLDLGVQIDNVVTFAISPARNGYEPARSKVLFRRVEEELKALPGVTGVAVSRVPLLGSSNWGNNVSVEGLKPDPDADRNSNFNQVGPGYFQTIGVPILAGREFTVGDDVGASKVAIVNEEFARKFELGRNPVGKRMAVGNGGPLDIEIIGLVKNAKYSEVRQKIPPQFALAIRQDSLIGRSFFYIRTAGDPAAVLRTVPGLIKRMDGTLPVEELKTMPQQIRENVFMDRMISTLSASFALLATILAAIGLYGMLAYSVAQRTREIGVRMALGADAGQVRLMILRQVGVMVAIGAVIGTLGAVLMGRQAQELLFELSSADPLVMAASVVVLSLVALSAGYVPALRASRVDPMQALRYE